MLPSFIIVGASRSGTTTMHQVLRQHPSLFLPKNKELHFFSNAKNFNRGVDHYKKYFRSAESQQIAGEISPPYFHKGITLDEHLHHHWDVEDDSASRIRALLPEVKIIVTLRNPIDRAYSQYWKNVGQGKEFASSFEDAIDQELSLKRTHETDQACWLYKNRYSVHVEHWLSLFPREQILFLVFEEWTQNPEKAFHDIYTFLGVNPIRITKADLSVANSTRTQKGGGIFQALVPKRSDSKFGKLYGKFATTPGYSQTMDSLLRAQLNEYFNEDIEKLERALGFSLDIWRP